MVVTAAMETMAAAVMTIVALEISAVICGVRMPCVGAYKGNTASRGLQSFKKWF
jgi:hypothetical protein